MGRKPHPKPVCSDCGKIVSRKSLRCAECAFEARRTWGNCKHCDKRFRVTPTYGVTFCSVLCSNGYNRLRGQARPVPWADCSECATPYVNRSGRTTCSDDCRKVERLRLREEQKDREARERLSTPLACKRCEAFFTRTQDFGRPPSYCASCLPTVTAENNRTARSTRRARLRGVECETFKPQEIFERDEWCCVLCMNPLDREAKVPSPFAPTIDHRVPIAKGGSHTRDNVQAAHFMCNSIKSSRDAVVVVWKDGRAIGLDVVPALAA